MHPMRLVSLLYDSLSFGSLPLGIFSIVLVYKKTPQEQRTFGYYLINLQIWTLLYDFMAGIAVKPLYRPRDKCVISLGFSRHFSEDYSLDVVVLTMQFLSLSAASLLSLVAHRYGFHIFSTFSQVFIGKRSFFVAYILHILPSVAILCAFVFLDFKPVVHEAHFSRFCSRAMKLWTLTSFLLVILAVAAFFFLLMLVATHRILHNLETSRGIMRTRTFALNIKTTYALFALIAAFFVFKLLPIAVWASASWIHFDLDMPVTVAHLLTIVGSVVQSSLILLLVPPYPSVLSKMWRWTRLRFPRNKLSYVQSTDSIKF
ncbi:hypothetical protein QR680_017789 [Steinernema hermaphroditum]|uniref:Uncharacterized protein n=1 Tax=Steinernema hermaphroditum TaxID=289476 RepID=A0AA39HGG9_9BILA|nr:hypothetical protein QR680_017789 [Steinernema hermaphroditum]